MAWNPYWEMLKRSQGVYTPQDMDPNARFSLGAVVDQSSQDPSGRSPASDPVDISEHFSKSVDDTTKLMQELRDAAKKRPNYFEDFDKRLKGESITQNALTLTPSQINVIADTMRDMPEYQQQKANVEDTKAMIKGYLESHKPQLDLTPAMAFADYVSGANLRDSYKAPENSQGMYDRMMKYQKDYQAQTEKLTEKLPELIRAAKGGMESQKLMEAIALSNGLKPNTDGLKPGQQGIQAQRFTNLFRGDSSVRDLQKQISDMGKFETGSLTPTWLTDVAKRAGLIASARLYPVSDRDMMFFSGSADLRSRAERGWQRLASGEAFTAKDRADIDAYLSVQKQIAANKLRALEDHYANNYGHWYGYSPEQALKMLRPAGGLENLGKDTSADQKTSTATSTNGMVKVRDKATNRTGFIKAEKLQDALKSGKFEAVQ